MSGMERVAVVTGGAQGIGRRTAELLAGRGYRIALIDLRNPAETADAITKNGGEAMSCIGNVAEEAVVQRCVELDVTQRGLGTGDRVADSLGEKRRINRDGVALHHLAEAPADGIGKKQEHAGIDDQVMKKHEVVS